MVFRPLAALAVFLPLAACDKLPFGGPNKDADGKAVGGACRHAGRALADCYAYNPDLPKAAIFAGWREMNDYMMEKKLDVVPPEIPAVVPPPRAEGEEAEPVAEKQPRSRRARAEAERAAREEAKAAEDKSTEKAAEKSAEKPSDRPGDKTQEKAADKPGDKAANKPTEAHAAAAPGEHPAEARPDAKDKIAPGAVPRINPIEHAAAAPPKPEQPPPPAEPPREPPRVARRAHK